MISLEKYSETFFIVYFLYLFYIYIYFIFIFIVKLLLLLHSKNTDCKCFDTTHLARYFICTYERWRCGSSWCSAGQLAGNTGLQQAGDV